MGTRSRLAALLLAGTFAVTAGCQSSVGEAGDDSAAAIVAGHAAGDASGVARLYLDGRPFCDGSIIAEDWLLTAAHCVDTVGSATDLTIRTGSTDLAKGTERGVAETIVHEGWRHGYLVNDIALVRLVATATATAVRTVKLAVCADAAKIVPSAAVTVVGWGATDASDEATQSTILEEASAGVLDCDPFDGYQNLDQKSVVCVGEPDGSRHSCKGDSGGPLFMTSGAGSRTQIGLDSWGWSPCGAAGKPSVFTRVDRYLDWIYALTDGKAGVESCAAPLSASGTGP